MSAGYRVVETPGPGQAPRLRAETPTRALAQAAVVALLARHPSLKGRLTVEVAPPPAPPAPPESPESPPALVVLPDGRFIMPTAMEARAWADAHPFVLPAEVPQQIRARRGGRSAGPNTPHFF